MLKKILSFILSVVMILGVLALVGCGDKQSSNGDVVVYSESNYPTLDNHAVFLMVDSDGNLRPDSALTVIDLTNALNALHTDKGSFSGSISADAAVNFDQLKAVLCRMYDEAVVAAVFATSGQSAVKRGEFAVGMCTLLGRGNGEKVAYSSLELPNDVTFSTENLSCLLEACIPHTVSQSGKTWSEIDLATGMKKGFNWVDGWLYYADENGYLLRNGKVGLLQFGADGRYTSGDSELDTTVAGILKTIIAENPDATRLELLRKAFIYSYEEFSYGNRYADDGNHNIYDLGHTGWEVKDAKNMFRTKQGNCYCFAAVFWALARGLGYDARAVAGTCLKDFQPHGWVIIKMNGEDYIFDPEWQWAYINEHKKFDKDMFMISLDAATWWNYRWDKSQ